MKNEEKQRIQKEFGIRDSDAIWDILKIIKEPIIQYEELARKIDQKTQQAALILKNIEHNSQRKMAVGIFIGFILVSILTVVVGYYGYQYGVEKRTPKEQEVLSCIKSGGSVGEDSANGRIACFLPNAERRGYYLK